MRTRARLERVTEKMKPAGRRRVFLKYAEDSDWLEHVNGDGVHRSDDEISAAEAAGDDVTCIVVEYVDGEDWRQLSR